MPPKSSKPTKIKTDPSVSKTVGYLRVSTNAQELEKNKSDILHLANHMNLGQVSFVEEIVSGKVSWKKRKIAEIIEEFKSMLECMEILSVAVEKGVRVYAVKGNWTLDNSIQSKIVAMAFSMASEIERDLISQRTKEALRYKKEQGIKLGRPPGKSKLDKFRPEIEALMQNGSTQKFIANRYGTTEANLHNWLKKTASSEIRSESYETFLPFVTI